MMQTRRWHNAADAQGMAAALSQAMQQHCRKVIAEKGSVRFGLAGGSTPMAAYADFARAELPWPQVHLALIDERNVPRDDPQSNEANIAQAFKDRRHQLGAWQGLFTEAKDLESMAEFSDSALRIFGLPLDCAVIGMGADGHIASLFVESPNYPAAMQLGNPRAVLPIRFAPEAGKIDRLSFTLSTLLATRHVLFCINGADKRDVLERSLDGRAPHYAAARFLAEYDGPVDIFWSPA
jgi:6-phosphogluconolactonase